MRCHSVVKCVLSVMLLFVAFEASAAVDQIECPSSKLVSYQAAKLDTIHLLPKQAYLIYSDAKTIYDDNSKRYWSIATMVGASDLNDAFLIANENVNSVNVQWDKYAKKFDGYYCKYTGSDVARVVFLITQDGGKADNISVPFNTIR